MRMARVCQADGAAIAARRILREEKHEIVVPRSRRDPDLFSITFLRLRILQEYSPAPSRASRVPRAIKFDLTSIYLRTYIQSAAAASASDRPFFLSLLLLPLLRSPSPLPLACHNRAILPPRSSNAPSSRCALRFVYINLPRHLSSRPPS